MNSRWSHHSTGRAVLHVGLVALATAVVGTLAGALVGVPTLPTALAPAVGIALGPVGVSGVVFGGLLRTLAAGTPTVTGVLAPLTDGVVAVVAFGLWGRRSLSTTGVRHRAIRIVTLGLVSLVAVTVGGAGRTWVATLVAGQSATALVPVVWTGQVLPALLLAVPASLALTRWHDALVSPARRPATLHRFHLVVTALLASGWFGAMFVHDVLRRDVSSLPHAGTQLAARLPSTLAEPVALTVGPSATLVHTLSGLGVLASLTVLARAGRPDEPDGGRGISGSGPEHVLEDEIIEA